MPTLSIDERWAIADRYYAEGCAAVEQADDEYARATDPTLAADFRATWWLRYERTAAYARTRFKRHDLQLTLLERDRAVLEANATTTP